MSEKEVGSVRCHARKQATAITVKYRWKKTHAIHRKKGQVRVNYTKFIYDNAH